MLWSRARYFSPCSSAACADGRMVRVAATLECRLLESNGARIGARALRRDDLAAVHPLHRARARVFYGTALIVDEIEDRTITYLFARPIRARRCFLGKYLSYCVHGPARPAVGRARVLSRGAARGAGIGSEFPSFWPISHAGRWPGQLWGVFALVGARLKRPLVIGLMFAFGWEPGVLLFPDTETPNGRVLPAGPGSSRHSAGLGRERAHAGLSGKPPVTTSLLSLTCITLVTLWLAARAVETREYVLEQ